MTTFAAPYVALARVCDHAAPWARDDTISPRSVVRKRHDPSSCAGIRAPSHARECTMVGRGRKRGVFCNEYDEGPDKFKYPVLQGRTLRPAEFSSFHSQAFQENPAPKGGMRHAWAPNYVPEPPPVPRVEGLPHQDNANVHSLFRERNRVPPTPPQNARRPLHDTAVRPAAVAGGSAASATNAAVEHADMGSGAAPAGGDSSAAKPKRPRQPAGSKGPSVFERLSAAPKKAPRGAMHCSANVRRVIMQNVKIQVPGRGGHADVLAKERARQAQPTPRGDRHSYDFRQYQSGQLGKLLTGTSGLPNQWDNAPAPVPVSAPEPPAVGRAVDLTGQALWGTHADNIRNLGLINVKAWHRVEEFMGADWGGTASQREEEPRRRPASARTTPVTAATRIASARGGRATGVQRATAWYQPHNTRVLSARCEWHPTTARSRLFSPRGYKTSTSHYGSNVVYTGSGWR